MSMYGKKRIVIQKNNQIVLAGGGSWFPVGLIVEYPDDVIQKYRKMGWIHIRAKVVKKLHSQHDGYDFIYAFSQKELRKVVNEKFNWI